MPGAVDTVLVPKGLAEWAHLKYFSTPLTHIIPDGANPALSYKLLSFPVANGHDNLLPFFKTKLTCHRVGVLVFLEPCFTNFFCFVYLPFAVVLSDIYSFVLSLTKKKEAVWSSNSFAPDPLCF